MEGVQLIEGKARILGDNISGDQIIAGRYLSGNVSIEKAVEHLFESCRPDLAASFQPGDILVAGHNFGCGSSREHVLQVLFVAGVKCVIAKSFSRSFFRGGINMGILPIQAAINVTEFDSVKVDLQSSTICVNDDNNFYSFSPFPQELQAIIRAGGLINFFRKHQSL